MNRPLWRILVCAWLVLLISAAPALTPARAQSTEVGEKRIVIDQVRTLVAQGRYVEGRRRLQQFEAGSGEKLDSIHREITDAFSAYLKSIEPKGQSYLIWLFGIVPLSICVVAAMVGFLLRSRSAVSDVAHPDDRRFGLYSAALVIATIFSFYIGTIAFYTFPKWFYFREWEYNRNEGFAQLIKADVWKGPVKGELSRRFLFNCQGTDDITVTLNVHGFRATPQIAPTTKILFLGDSLGWGMNVTDEETFPTVLSRTLHAQIATGLGDFSRLLNYPDFDENPLIVEVLAWTGFMAPIPPVDAPLPVVSIRRPPVSGAAEAIERSFLFQTHVRYSLPHILARAAKRLAGDLDYWFLRDQQEYIFPRYFALSDEKIEDADRWVEQVAERSRKFKELGFTYVAVPVPEPPEFFAEYVNPRFMNIHKYFNFKAALRGVHVVDLLRPFVEDGGGRLYQITDGHWNGAGASLGAKVAARYIQEHNLFAARSEQIAPDQTEPAYDEDFRLYLERHFRPEVSISERTCVRPFSEFVRPIAEFLKLRPAPRRGS